MEAMFLRSLRDAGDARAFRAINYARLMPPEAAAAPPRANGSAAPPPSSSSPHGGATYEAGGRWAVKLDFVLGALHACAMRRRARADGGAAAVDELARALLRRALGGGGAADDARDDDDGGGDGDDDILVVSDVDVAFARPGLAALARGYLRGRDAVFQGPSTSGFAGASKAVG